MASFLRLLVWLPILCYSFNSTYGSTHSFVHPSIPQSKIDEDQLRKCIFTDISIFKRFVVTGSNPSSDCPNKFVAIFVDSNEIEGSHKVTYLDNSRCLVQLRRESMFFLGVDHYVRINSEVEGQHILSEIYWHENSPTGILTARVKVLRTNQEYKIVHIEWLDDSGE